MPKVNKWKLDEAINEACGGVHYKSSTHVGKWKEIRQMTGITKGQWKRFQLGFDDSVAPDIVVSELTAKKLQVMAKHGKSQHLLTLLKMVEHTMETDYEQ